MNIYDQIFTPEIIKRIQNRIDAHDNLSRSKLSQEVCEWLDWRSANSSFKEGSCRKALLKLHRTGFITLPLALKGPPRCFQRDDILEEIIEAPIETDLDELGNIEIVVVKRTDRKSSRLWNGLMARYHYLGAGPLCGAQMRYFIRSSNYGLLGGLSFSSAAWKLEARDRWIDWDEAARVKNLDKVITNNRFLILPWVKVPNLASHVLSLCLKCLRSDWRKRYAVEPVLVETFVEKERFKGSCYKASNFIYAGQSKGRGRNDRFNAYGLAIKEVYLYPLRHDAQKILSQGRKKPKLAFKEPQDWAEEEFAMASLGDVRRVRRLMEMARDFYERPQANIPQACQSRARSKAAYRFLEDKNNTMEKILEPHYEATRNRSFKEKVVLAVQDTTKLNYSTHPATQDLGLIGYKQDGLVGLIVHDTLCFNLEGTPLGLLDVQVWARDPADFGKKHLRHQLSIEQKESNKWLKSFKAIQKVQKRCADTLFVSIGDREADIYELFKLALSEPKGPALLVRAEHKRLLADGQGQVWDYVAGLPISGIKVVHVPRRGNKKARQARLEVRYAQVHLKPPKTQPQLGELSLWAILVEEVNCPEGNTPLKWMLFTTIAVQSFEQADEKVNWYCSRWGIEVYHRTLKSGCKIERRQLGSADRIEACLAIDMVIAWRIHHLTKLGREVPEAPCTVFFEDCEWKALVAYKTQNPTPPEKPPTLREMTHMVASLGGFLGRKCDGNPGTQTLWLGLQRLDDITDMWKVFMRDPPHG
jgi:hypothetical protein